MKNDATIVRAAVQQDWRAHNYASKEMQTEESIKAIVRDVIQKEGLKLREASQEMKGDQSIVRAAAAGWACA